MLVLSALERAAADHKADTEFSSCANGFITAPIGLRVSHVTDVCQADYKY